MVKKVLRIWLFSKVRKTGARQPDIVDKSMFVKSGYGGPSLQRSMAAISFIHTYLSQNDQFVCQSIKTLVTILFNQDHILNIEAAEFPVVIRHFYADDHARLKNRIIVA